MMTLSKVAIILATYNGAEFVAQQMASISRQLNVDWHVFVRDDGSTDETLPLVIAMMSEDRLTVIDSDGWQTGSPAGNFFAALTKINIDEFDYFCFSDQDDIWAPDKLDRAITCLKTAGADGYSSDLVAFDVSRQRAWYVRKSQAMRSLDYIFQGASAGCTYVLSNAAAALIKKKVEPLYGRFPVNKSHDWLIYAICRSHGLTWFQDSSAFIFYRQHARNAFGALPRMKGLLTRLAMARSGWYRAHVLWLRDFLSGTPDEITVFNRVSRLGWSDRVWLARRCFDFRRGRLDAILLAASIMCGAF